MRKMDIFVFEGLDGSGKGSIMDSVASTIGVKTIKTPLEPFRSKMKRFSLQKLDSLTCAVKRRRFLRDRLEFFVEANYHAAEHALSLGEPLLVDRWVYTTLAYHYAFDPELEFLVEVPSFSHTFPTTTFLVNIPDRSLWLQRISSRASKRSYIDEWVMRDHDLSDRIYNNYKRLIPRFTEVINNSDLSSAVRQVLLVIAH